LADPQHAKSAIVDRSATAGVNAKQFPHSLVGLLRPGNFISVFYEDCARRPQKGFFDRVGVPIMLEGKLDLSCREAD
jgi:hypothetical protein